MTGNCSFCGKSGTEVFRMITTDGVKICNECVGKCADQIADEYRKVARDVQFPPSGGGRRDMTIWEFIVLWLILQLPLGMFAGAFIGAGKQ